MFVLHDGAVISMKTGRLVRSAPPKPGVIGPVMPGQGEWDATPSIAQLMAGMGKPGPAEDPNIDEVSRKYWARAAEEAKKLESSMTPEQKASFAAFEARFPPSRLVDEPGV